jgi:hypothetical protein
MHRGLFFFDVFAGAEDGRTAALNLETVFAQPNSCQGPETRLQGDMIRLRPDRVPMPAGVIFCPPQRWHCVCRTGGAR